MDMFINDLQERLSAPLPGRAAQVKMANIRRIEELGLSYTIPDSVKIASVLVLFHQSDEDADWRIVLIQRSANPLDRHSGQVSFPGGRVEADDASLAAAAQREAHEEVGVPPAKVEIIGRLTELYVPVSNFLVHPFVGVLREPADFVPQPGEVASILNPRMKDFLATERRKVKDVRIGQDITLRDVPYFEVDEWVIWGATAMIISELTEVLTK